MVASRAIIGNTAGVATSAGYWAAATVISNDRTVPAWASWSPSTYRALAALDGVAGLEPEDRLPLLAEAVGHDPDSGLILMKLANELELASKPLAALQLSVRAVICHPHYLPFRAVAAQISHRNLSKKLGIVGHPAGSELSRVLDADLRPMELPKRA